MPDVTPLPSRLLAEAETKAWMHSAIEILADRAGRISQVH
jgi:hypothetical protein